jgi:pyruvate ferredoxin oxidoreductase gamma subunit
MIEVRWHGRGGQGAKTAALLFADAVLATGKYVQGFPEYGPERMGAPVQSFNRIDDHPITLHCGVTSPQVVVVLDPTLMDSLDLTQGLPADGAIIINTNASPADMRAKTGMKTGKVYTVDATTISRECIGMDKPNTPMMGALVKVIGSQGLKLDLNEVVTDTEQKLKKKFAHKPEVIKGNLDCLRRAYNETKGE